MKQSQTILPLHARGSPNNRDTSNVREEEQQQHYDEEMPPTAINEERPTFRSYFPHHDVSPLMERSLLDEATAAADVPVTTRRRRRSTNRRTANSSRFDAGLSLSATNSFSRTNDNHDDVSVEEVQRFSAPAPPLKDFLLADDAYRDLLLGHRQKKSILEGLEHVNDVDVATGCAWFSGIGMAFLLFVGMLIEKQPLYIKGIKLQRQGNSYSQTMKRQTLTDQMHNRRASETDDFGQEDDIILAGSAGKYRNKKLIQKMGSSGNQQERRKNRYRNGNENYEYKMIKEASSAFKAAAAYFLTLVLSLTYIQIHDKINFDVQSMLITPAHVRYYCLSLYRKYRRRQYINIPDTSSTTPDIHVYTEHNENRYQQHSRSHGIWKTMTNLKGRVLGRRERRTNARLKKRR